MKRKGIRPYEFFTRANSAEKQKDMGMSCISYVHGEPMTNCVRVSQTTGVGEAMTPPAGLCLHNFICTLHKALLIKVIESIFSFSCIGI